MPMRRWCGALHLPLADPTCWHACWPGAVSIRKGLALSRSDLRETFPNPSSFADMDRAAEVVLDAILSKRRVTVFADYDVDGGTSSAILARYFRAWGRTLASMCRTGWKRATVPRQRPSVI